MASFRKLEAEFPTLNRWRHAVQDLAIVSTGLALYGITKKTPEVVYQSMRRLYWLTRGRSNRLLSRLLERRAEAPRAVAGVLGALKPPDLDCVVAQLRRDGYYIFPERLDSATCDALTAFARVTPAHMRPNPNGAGPVLFDPARPQAPVYHLPERELCAQPAVQSLLADESILMLAERYLECRPLNDLVAMWWSAVSHGKASSEAAQLYHFDMDRLKFLKVFFYLTDVTPDNGPHCYVVGSHREKPAQLWVDGRLQDDVIARGYGADRMHELTGPRGTIIAVDTSGFHKGKPLVSGHRLIFQLEYTSSFFGGEVLRARGRTKLAQMTPAYADAFARFVD